MENPSYGADLAHWTIIFGLVTKNLQGHQFTTRIIQETNFCNDNCRNPAKMRQAHHGAVGLYKEIETFQLNNCVSNYEYDIRKLTS